jgi:CTP synthase
VKELRAVGIQPDFIVARCPTALPDQLRRKIALFCDVPGDHVIEDRDLPSIYEVPLRLAEEEMDLKLLRRLDLKGEDSDLRAWEDFVRRLQNPEGIVRIGIVGKYVELHDAYLSLVEALRHAGAALGVGVDIQWIPAEGVEKAGEEALAGIQGIIVPGGFGERGIEGKIRAADYARRRGTPFLGICLGMQVAAIAFARTVLGRKNANSTEFDPNTPDPVIDLLPEQTKVKEKGGTMRLGEYPAELVPESKIQKAYNARYIQERHRHRYEFNPQYLELFSRAGFVPSALSPDGKLVEALELRDHPWYVAVQFHPEFRSRPLRPHPLFLSFLRACLSS